MQDEEKRRELLDFLDKKIFEPVLEAFPQQYSSERDQRMLREVQQEASRTRVLLHDRTRSAQEVRNFYLKDLYFETIGQLGKELEDLELPRLREVRSEFLELCQKLRI